jgi:cytochrome oxidase Cu insertion factor (SCO1/SenC/PrrC family)
MLRIALACAAGLAMVAAMRPSTGSGRPEPAEGRGAVPDELKVGDPAPPFSLPGSDGKTHTLAEYRGKTVVLAWFPKAFTGG